MTHYQVVRKTQCRLGYTESHTAAPGFGPGEVTEAAFLISKKLSPNQHHTIKTDIKILTQNPYNMIKPT